MLDDDIAVAVEDVAAVIYDVVSVLDDVALVYEIDVPGLDVGATVRNVPVGPDIFDIAVVVDDVPEILGETVVCAVGFPAHELDVPSASSASTSPCVM